MLGFVAALGLSLVVENRGTVHCGESASLCGGFSSCGAHSLGTQASAVAAPGAQSAGSVVVVHGFSDHVACGIFPDQGLNLCLLRWQVDS